MRTLRLGLAGLGHGRTLLQANQPEHTDLPVRVTALCDANPELLQSMARQPGVETVTTDFDALVAREDLDIIGIYTPGPLHCEQILAALEAGRHVMVTKSMVYSIAEVEQVVAAVDRSGLTLLVTQSLRGRLDFMDAKRACDAGEIGEMFMAEAHYVARPAAGLPSHALADRTAAGPDSGRGLSPDRFAALVHGGHRGGALRGSAQRRGAGLPSGGLLLHQRALRQREGRPRGESAGHGSSARRAGQRPYGLRHEGHDPKTT